ncbi:MAG TPA: hypothetical protein PLB05_00960 [Candidatus Omnitrophota bacterium]|jgi:hypothetical protein|nr:hypothetical protein [Candidatus Omnitrophota bacterium]HPN55458.1 hypothetical protein [Candidatus Omnitrophota bacterium]
MMKNSVCQAGWCLDMISLWCMLVIFLTLLQGRALAGGAAAMKKQRGPQIQQRMMQEEMIQQRVLQETARQEHLAQQHASFREQEAKTRALSSEQLGVQSEADFSDVIQDLFRTSRAWTLMVDADAKEAVVAYFLKEFRGKGIVIQKPAWYYAGLIESMSQESPEMLAQPFDRVLQVVAIIEYDYENGQDKDMLAYQILGSKEAVVQNRQRLGLP